MFVLSLKIFKTWFSLQVRVSDSYHSCNDSARAAKEVHKSDKFQITQEQSLQNDDMGNVTCTENSKGTELWCVWYGYF